MPPSGMQAWNPYTDAQAFAGQWGYRLATDGNFAISLSQVGRNSVTTGFAVLAAGMSQVWDLSSQDAMDKNGADINGGTPGDTPVNTYTSTQFGVYWCSAGDFSGGLGFCSDFSSVGANASGQQVLNTSSSSNGYNCLFLGRMYVDSTGRVANDLTHRHLINWYNRRSIPIYTALAYSNNNAATTFTLQANAWANMRGASGDDTLSYIANGQDPITVTLCAALGAAAPAAVVQIGIADNNSTTPAVAATFANAAAAGTSASCSYTWTPAAGQRTVVALGYTANLVTTFQADLARNGASADPPATYLVGSVWA